MELGIGNIWTLVWLDNGKVSLKSWKGDYLHRPDTNQGVTTWNTGLGDEWEIEWLNKPRLQLVSWKDDLLARDSSPSKIGTTTDSNGSNTIWEVDFLNANYKIKLKSNEGDFLHRPDSPQGVTTWYTGIGNEWYVIWKSRNKLKLQSWKGDFLHRPDTAQGVTTLSAEIGNEWTVVNIC